jgi:uncharacterized membrane protein YeaQ/YmgE (transglycosylase-associated protein family)
MRGDLFGLLDQLGLAWQNIVNGVVGATVWALHKKANFATAIRQIFIGAMVAGYSTPFISAEFSIRDMGFLSFVIGVVGMVLLDRLYVWLSNKIKLLFGEK